VHIGQVAAQKIFKKNVTTANYLTCSNNSSLQQNIAFIPYGILSNKEHGTHLLHPSKIVPYKPSELLFSWAER
jgi:hypothetical protein